MKPFRRVVLGLVAGTGLAVGVSPALAATQLTDAFVANVKPNVDFLDKSSRLALQRSPGRALKAYAQDVAARETIVENSIVAWWQTNTPDGASAALGTSGPVPMPDPLAPLGRLAGDVEGMVDGGLSTGRSVALDGPTPATTSPSKPLLPSQEADYETLKTLKGRRFDAFYKLTQRNALRQLVALYRDYAARGDDPSLRSIATLQLQTSNDLIRRLNLLR